MISAPFNGVGADADAPAARVGRRTDPLDEIIGRRIQWHPPAVRRSRLNSDPQRRARESS